MLLIGFQMHSEMLLGIYTQQVLAGTCPLRFCCGPWYCRTALSSPFSGMVTPAILASLAMLSPVALILLPNWFLTKPKYRTLHSSGLGLRVGSFLRW